MNARNKVLGELTELKRVMRILEDALQKPTWNELEKMGMGASLTAIYGGYERIFRILLEDRGIRIVKSEYWHADLLSSAVENNIAPIQLRELLNGMLSFRHFQVHGYGHKIKENLTRQNSAEVVKSFNIFERHINSILNEKERTT